MKRKIFKIICIAVVSLLSLAILVGAFMVAIITPKNETISASADTSSATPYFVRQDLYFGYDMLSVGRYIISGETSTSEVNNYEYLAIHLYELPSSPFTVDIVNVNNYNCEITLLLRFGDSYSVYPLNNGFIEVSSLGSNFSGNGFIRFSNGSFSSNVPYDFILYFYSGSHIDNYNIAFDNGFKQGFNVAEHIYYDVGYDEGYQDGINAGYEDGYSVGSTDGYERGYDEGYDLGYEDGVPVGYDTGFSAGYSDGHSDGLNLGHSDRITNPISSFIEPVHQFMNTPFFGTLTYATIFNIVLFVAVAVIFVKMFSGG